ncbi:hypothetical protein PAXRUDRAFT_22505 [Paxillus rubicundulus Ve08.2h10]|uniref:Uncharacterized protein n=1 Tax=Paxillus rubicundulus Ve08.2h10 TaxID=930991 RepID=A0A0D0CN12_9AGAM|nr:hypothetical protein PAXRUDRAFT_22505 [Paxillus rubicundulus Ve08.2h10]
MPNNEATDTSNPNAKAMVNSKGETGGQELAKTTIIKGLKLFFNPLIKEEDLTWGQTTQAHHQMITAMHECIRKK